MKKKKIVKKMEDARNNLEKLLQLAMRDIAHADVEDLKDMDQLKDMIIILNKWLSEAK